MKTVIRIMPKQLHCKTFYKLLVKSKTGKWEVRMFACKRRSLEPAIGFYREKFGKRARIVEGHVPKRK